MGEQACSVTILHIGGGDDPLEHEALRVDPERALAPLPLRVRVVAARPPLCPVLTDWLSRMAALGVASRPRGRRGRSRSAVWIVSPVPSLRQMRK